MKFVIGLLFCVLLNSSLTTAQPPEGPPQKIPCLDDEFNALMIECHTANKPTGKPQDCLSKKTEEKKKCMAENQNIMKKTSECIFNKAGVLSQNKIDLEAAKTYISKHSTISSDQKSAAVNVFEQCMKSTTKSASMTPTDSMKAMSCMANSLNKHGCLQTATQ